MKRLWADYLQDILDAIDDIESFVSAIDFDEFTEDKKTIHAVVRCLEIVGEAAKNIPESARIKHPEVPWRRMAAMRDKLSHEYFGVDESIVWAVATEELPPLRPLIKKMLDESESEKN